MTVGENVNDYMRDEHRSASRNAPAWWEGRRVGDRIVDDPDLPDLSEWDEPA